MIHLFENYKNIVFLILNISFLIFYETLIRLFKLIINNKKLLSLFILFLIILTTIVTLEVKNKKKVEIIYQRAIDKVNFVFDGNFFRNDNWYNVSKNTIIYNKNDEILSNFSFSKIFENYNEFQNIFVIINESYPNFKDKSLNYIIFKYYNP